MAEERLLQIRLTLRDLRLIRHLAIDHECMPMRRRPDGMIEMQAIAPESTVAKLRSMHAQDVRVEVVRQRPDAAASAKDVSQTNRYTDGSLPRGAARRGPPKRGA
jgi:hypothetical protein